MPIAVTLSQFSLNPQWVTFRRLNSPLTATTTTMINSNYTCAILWTNGEKLPQ